MRRSQSVHEHVDVWRNSETLRWSWQCACGARGDDHENMDDAIAEADAHD